MAIGPRLDLRQSQTLVMTPQLRQAIKLLQFSNSRWARSSRRSWSAIRCWNATSARAGERARAAAPDQVVPVNGHAADAAEMARPEILPTEAAAPLDMGDAETFDAGGAADGAPSSFAPTGAAAAPISATTSATSTIWRRRRRTCATIWASSSGWASTIRWTG